MAFAADRAKVNKDIFTAIPCNKAESLGGVEPLNLSLLALALFRGLSAGSDAAAAGFLGASIGFNGSARACEKSERSATVATKSKLMGRSSGVNV